jgi:hypothetical protein
MTHRDVDVVQELVDSYIRFIQQEGIPSQTP